MNKATVFYSDNKSENFETDDFNVIYSSNPRKSEIKNIQITKTVLENKTKILFEAIFQNDTTGVNFYKAWPTKVINEKFEFLKPNDPVGNLEIEAEEKRLCLEFRAMIEIEKAA